MGTAGGTALGKYSKVSCGEVVTENQKCKICKSLVLQTQPGWIITSVFDLQICLRYPPSLSKIRYALCGFEGGHS